MILSLSRFMHLNWRSLLKLSSLIVVFASSVIGFSSEFYSSRPDIWAIETDIAKPKDLDFDLEEVKKLIRGNTDFVIQLYLFYGDRQRLHLARDGEMAYDIDSILWQRFQEARLKLGPKAKLINVSTLSSQVEPELLLSYLKSVGFSTADHNSGIKPVLIDTGFEGTIPNAINATLKKWGYVQSHFVSSVHPKIPSSRMATTQFFPVDEVDEKNKSEYLDAVDQFIYTVEEGLSHFTQTATNYVEVDDRLEPVAQRNQPEGEKQKALYIMAFTKNEVDTKATIARAINIYQTLQAFLLKLNGEEPLAENDVKVIDDFLVRMKWHLFWPDLRETVAKGNFIARNERMIELWRLLPGGLPDLVDLDADELSPVLKAERKLYGKSICTELLSEK